MHKEEPKRIVKVQDPREMLAGKPTPIKNRHLIEMLVNELELQKQKIEDLMK